MQRTMRKALIIVLVSLGVLFGGIFAYKAFVSYMIAQYFKTAGQQVSTVSAIKVNLQSWQPQVKAAGSLRAVRGVDITTEIAGLVRTIYFKPGADVKAGELLVDLNADSDIAKLQSLQANEALAEIVLKRDKAQLSFQGVSKAVVDADQANLKSVQAQVTEQAAIVEKKRIRAPFTGRLGVSRINPGQFLNPGDKIVTLQQLSPIYADFYLPQQQLVHLATGQLVTLNTDTYPEKIFKGKITTIDPKVDPDTRNIEIEATIDNKSAELFPGMYATVLVNLSGPKQYLTLPITAISFNPYGELVYVVKQSKDEKGKTQLIAIQTFVTVGDTRGNQIAVLSGIKAGDLIVTSGQLKIKNGSPVVINNSVVPNDNPNPIVSNE